MFLLSLSMWQLVKRDGLGVQYIALTVLWNGALGYTPFKRPKTFFQLISLVSDSVPSPLPVLIVHALAWVGRLYRLHASPFICWNSSFNHQPGTQTFSPS